MQILVTTPNNPDYSGKTLGVQFAKGQAIITEHTRNEFGFSVEQLADKFRRDVIGYEVEILEDSDRPLTTTKRRAKVAE